MTSVREIGLTVATRESVAAYGELIGIDGESTALPTDFYDGTVRLYAPARFVSDDDTQITVARIDRRPLEVRWMERHFKHTQAFIPLGGKPFIAVLAPPTDSDLPVLDEARAFLFDGSAGFLMHVGTWHEFPFSVLDGSQVVVILRRETTRNLMKDAVVDGEAHGPDLDKKDLVRRTGAVIKVVC